MKLFVQELRQPLRGVTDLAELDERLAPPPPSTVEIELRARMRQLSAVAELGQRALTTDDLSGFLHEATATVARILGVPVATFLEMLPDENSMLLRSSVGLRDGIMGRLRLSRLGDSLSALTLITGAPVLVEDLAKDTRFRPHAVLLEHGITSGLAVVVGKDAAPAVGVLGVFSATPRGFSAEDVQFVQSVANVVAGALLRERLESTMRQRDQLFSTVYEKPLAASQRRETELALRSSEASYRSLIEGLPDGITVFRDGCFVYANPAFLSMFGFSSLAELAGRPLLDCFFPQDHRALAAALGDEERLGAAIETRMKRHDGGAVSAELYFLKTVFNGHPAHLAITRDITDRRHMQAQLFFADRMASVGTLAAGVAHEINNPLACVIANLSYITEELGREGAPAVIGGSEIELALAEAQQGAERVRRIVRDLKTFSRGDEERREQIDVRPLLDSSINLAWNEIRHRAELSRDYGNVGAVLGNSSSVAQVFLNLLVNAAQAIPEGHLSENKIHVAVREAEGFVEIEISDTGVGIPPDVIDRIFDPFFTTKNVGVGTGLGLSICHSIVTSLGGRISVESLPKRGTRCRVSLPLAASAQPKKAVLSSVGTTSRGRILVVDDEPTVGWAMRRALSGQHDVVTLDDARVALERIAGGEQFDVILCDLMMPEMTGAQLHGQLCARSPESAKRMVFLTGGAFTPSARQFLDAVANERLDKPFDLDQLRDLVRKMVDQSLG